MAVITCPHCHKYISSLVTRCPECGKELKNNGVNEDSDGLDDTVSSNDSETTSNEENVAKIKSSADPSNLTRRLRVILKRVSYRRIALFLATILTVTAVTFFLIKDCERSANLEQRAFDRLTGCTNLNFYEDYIVRFPDGKHIDEVKKLYAQVKTQSAQFYQQTSNGTKEELLLFIKNNPSSPYCKVCELRIDSLDWQDASAANTVSAYGQYLADHPQGIFVEVANETKNRLAKLEVTEEERSKLHGMLDSFLSALASNDAGRIDQLLGGPITFCSQTGMSGEGIVTLNQQHFNSPDILGVHFALQGGLSIKKRPSASSAGEYVYTINAQYEATLNRTATDSTHVQTWAFTAQLTPDRKVTSIDMRRQN